MATKKATRAQRIPTRVVVPNVRIAKGMVQRVVFRHNKAKHIYVAKTKGCPIIRVNFHEGDNTFHAVSGAVDVKDADASRAFAKATRHLWVA